MEKKLGLEKNLALFLVLALSISINEIFSTFLLLSLLGGVTTRYSSFSNKFKTEIYTTILIFLILGISNWGLSLPIYIPLLAIAAVLGGEISLNILNPTWRKNRTLLYLLSSFTAALITSIPLGYRLDIFLLPVLIAAITSTTVRSVYYRYTWIVITVTWISVTLLHYLSINTSPIEITVASLITFGLAALAYKLDAMDETGALAGVILSLTTILIAGYNWFMLLGLFVVLGASSTRYRYQEKLDMGIVMKNEKRSLSNVFANGSVALFSVLAFSFFSSESSLTMASLAFCAGLATATADTLSSEIGCVHGEPLLITSMNEVEPGTDGGISIIGEIMTLAASLIIAVAALLLGLISPFNAVLVTIGGVVGGHMDSLLGATLEDKLLGNNSVNLLATVAGAISTILLYLAIS